MEEKQEVERGVGATPIELDVSVAIGSAKSQAGQVKISSRLKGGIWDV